MVILKSVLPVNLITLVVCILLSFMISRVITSPIKEMVVTIRSIEQHSDLTQRMDDSGKDEISQVGRTINAMLEKFQHILKDVNGATLSVAEAAQTMSRTIAETAEGIEQQKREAHQLASSANELLAAVNDVANNALHAAQSAQDANQHAGKGKVEVDITIESINGLAHEVESAVGVMDKLNGEAEQIGAVVDVIKSIAEQTNLLALNAAIEAARAGEQGRGFAVVADEVRTLAKRTQESTSEIEGMIRHLQQGAGDAVQTMKAGEERSLACVEQAGHAGEALELITSVVEQIASMNSQIASAAEQQTEATDNINCFITNIGNIADQNADKAVNCSSLSEQLAKLADSLQINVSKFKV
jgi:methyl-accepting chemotaxis protein